jgi:hypothetical protein
VDKCRNDVVGVFPNAVELLRLASSLRINGLLDLVEL